METPSLHYIDSISEGDNDFKQQLINILKEDFPKEKALFLNNFNNKKYKLAAENVHKIKHKISMMGLEKGFIMASEFEENLKKKNTDLHKNFIHCLTKITKFLNSI